MAKGLTVKIRADASQFEKTMVGVKSKLRSLTPSFTAIAATAAATGASIIALGYGISRMVKSASQEAANFETLSTQMEVLTGSTANAKKLLDELTTFGATTPLEQGDLQQASKTLLGFGITLDKVMPTLRMLGDVSMGDGQKLQQLALVFGQVSSAGRLMGGDVLQMINSGFNPLVQISKRTGESMIALKKRMEDGGISSDEVTQAFKDATSEGGLFDGMLAKIAETTEGKLSNLSDNIAKLKRGFGIGFNEGLKVALDATNEFLPKLEKKFAEAGVGLGNALADAVNGDMQKLILIGKMIGDTIMEGLKLSLRGITDIAGQFYLETLESQKYNPLGALSRKFGGAEKHKLGGEYQMDVEMQKSMNSIRENYAAMMQQLNQPSQSQQTQVVNYTPPEWITIGGEIKRSIEVIERNTRPTLFPTQ